MRILTTLQLGLVLCFGVAAQPSSREALSLKSEQARAAMAAGEFGKAVSLYRELSESLPDLPGPRMNLGIALYLDGQYGEAVEELQAVAAKSAELAPSLLYLGASHLQLSDPGSALPPLRAYLQARPGDLQGTNMLAEALLSLGEYGDAATHYRQLTARQPEAPRVWYGLGRCYEALARQAFERLAAEAAGSPYWLALLADARLAQQQYQSAFFLYREAIQQQPIRGIHVAISQIYRQTGHADWAEVEERKELEMGLPDCASEQLVCDFLAGRLHEVVESGQRQNTHQALYWMSKAYDRLALAAYSRLALLPPSFELHSVTAEVHRDNGKHREAAAQWRSALEISPGNPIARRELALSLFLARDYDAAEPLVRALLEAEPQSAQLNFLAGAIRLNREQAAEAVPFLERALQYDPRLEAAQSSLGRAYLSLGETGKAIPHLEAALSSDEDGSLHYQLSRAYQSSGRPDEARAMLEKYQQLQGSLERERERLSEEVQITPPS